MSLAFISPSGTNIAFPAGQTQVSGSIDGLAYSALLGTGVGPLFQWNAFVSDQDWAPGLWSDPPNPASRWYAPSQRAVQTAILAGLVSLQDAYTGGRTITGASGTGLAVQIGDALGNCWEILADPIWAQVSARGSLLALFALNLYFDTTTFNWVQPNPLLWGVGSVAQDWLGDRGWWDIFINGALQQELGRFSDGTDLWITANDNAGIPGQPALHIDSAGDLFLSPDTFIINCGLSALQGITTITMNNQLTNTLAAPAFPFVITSNVMNPNLNADLLDGIHAAGFAPAPHAMDDAAYHTSSDLTVLDASTTKHGFLLKAVAPAANVLNVVGIANGGAAWAIKTLFDATNPAALGVAAPGTSLLAAHRDHVHPVSTRGDVDYFASSESTHVPIAQFVACVNNDTDVIVFRGRIPTDLRAGGKVSFWLDMVYCQPNGTVAFWKISMYRGPKDGIGTYIAPAGAGANVVNNVNGPTWNGENTDTCIVTLVGGWTGVEPREFDKDDTQFTAGDAVFISMTRHNSVESSHWNQYLGMHITYERDL